MRSAFFHLVTHAPQDSARRVILIGGCARTGKSTLAHQLQSMATQHTQTVTLISLDWWIVSASQRPVHSTVIQRYEIPRLVNELQALLAGHAISPPRYDPISRERVAQHQAVPIQAPEGWIVVEGVIALAIPLLLSQAAARIYVHIPDEIRRQRLYDFYCHTKGFGAAAAWEFIQEREQEETPWVKATAQGADYCYDST